MTMSVANPTIGAELRTERERYQRSAARGKVRALRTRAAEVRAMSREARAAAKAFCRAAKEAVRAKSARERHRDLSAQIRAEKASARSACDLRKGEARKLLDAAAVARAELDAERKYQAEIRRIEASNRARASARVVRASVVRSESDDEVRGNIPPELVPLFESVKRSIRASDRKSRTEAFLEYAEAHPGEWYAAIEDETERRIAEMQARMRAPNPRRARRGNPSAGAEEYERLHWGDQGLGRARSAKAPDPSVGPIVKLGDLREVAYLTTKQGDPPGTIYEHEFKPPYPSLCVNGEGKLLIVGGGYAVEARGIVR
jgi:hypothetical protein